MSQEPASTTPPGGGQSWMTPARARELAAAASELYRQVQELA